MNVLNQTNPNSLPLNEQETARRVLTKLEANFAQSELPLFNKAVIPSRLMTAAKDATVLQEVLLKRTLASSS